MQSIQCFPARRIHLNSSHAVRYWRHQRTVFSECVWQVTGSPFAFRSGCDLKGAFWPRIEIEEMKLVRFPDSLAPPRRVTFYVADTHHLHQ